MSFEDRPHDREDYGLAALVHPKQRLGTKCQSVDLYQEELSCRDDLFTTPAVRAESSDRWLTVNTFLSLLLLLLLRQRSEDRIPGHLFGFTRLAEAEPQV